LYDEYHTYLTHDDTAVTATLLLLRLMADDNTLTIFWGMNFKIDVLFLALLPAPTKNVPASVSDVGR